MQGINEEKLGPPFVHFPAPMRDYFAAMAMQSLISTGGDANIALRRPEIARSAYCMADVMMIQRGQAGKFDEQRAVELLQDLLREITSGHVLLLDNKNATKNTYARELITRMVEILEGNDSQ